MNVQPPQPPLPPSGDVRADSGLSLADQAAVSKSLVETWQRIAEGLARALDARNEEFRKALDLLNARERDLHDRLIGVGTLRGDLGKTERERDEYRETLRKTGRVIGPNPEVKRIWERVENLKEERDRYRQQALLLIDDNSRLRTEVRIVRAALASPGSAEVFRPVDPPALADPRAPLGAHRRVTLAKLWDRFYDFADAVGEVVAVGKASVAGRPDPVRAGVAAQKLIDLAEAETTRRAVGYLTWPPPAPVPAEKKSDAWKAFRGGSVSSLLFENRTRCTSCGASWAPGAKESHFYGCPYWKGVW